MWPCTKLLFTSSLWSVTLLKMGGQCWGYQGNKSKSCCKKCSNAKKTLQEEWNSILQTVMMSIFFQWVDVGVVKAQRGTYSLLMNSLNCYFFNKKSFQQKDVLILFHVKMDFLVVWLLKSVEQNPTKHDKRNIVSR